MNKTKLHCIKKIYKLILNNSSQPCLQKLILLNRESLTNFLVEETRRSKMLISKLVTVEHDLEPLLFIPHPGNKFLQHPSFVIPPVPSKRPLSNRLTHQFLIHIPCFPHASVKQHLLTVSVYIL